MQQGEQPNIVLILNDDMGYSDIGCYGGEVHTPNLDALANQGLRFSQFYNTARCCPSRASLLTGLHPHQTGVGHMMRDDGLEGYVGDLNNRCVTIAEALKENGYATYMSGKWHVTRHIHEDGPKHSWPCQRGFDKFYGMITGAASYWQPRTLTRGNEPIHLGELPSDYFVTDAISREAADQIRNHANKAPSRPFFSYVAYTAPHWPLHAHEEDIARYKGRFEKGWDKLREERMMRMRQLGIIDEQWKLSDRDPSQPPWEETEHKEWQQRRMEVYAAQIDRMDQGIGEIVEALRDTGQLDNTLLIFLSDNGGCAEGNVTTAKPVEETDNGVRIKIKTQYTRDGEQVYSGNDPNIMPGPEATYQSYGTPWANLSNTPFREYKHWVHEGGIATPLIVHWPEKLQGRSGLIHQPCQLPDIMATCLDVSGTEYPEYFRGESIHALEGTSMAPLFEGESMDKEYLVWEHEGNKAIRQGKWKLVAKYSQDWELYDMENDRTETNDCSRQYPEFVKKLEFLYWEWAERCYVKPWEDIQARRQQRR